MGASRKPIHADGDDPVLAHFFTNVDVTFTAANDEILCFKTIGIARC